MRIRSTPFSDELEQATTPSFGRMPQRALAFTGSVGSIEPRRALALSEASSHGSRRRQASRGDRERPLDLVRELICRCSSGCLTLTTRYVWPCHCSRLPLPPSFQPQINACLDLPVEDAVGPMGSQPAGMPRALGPHPEVHNRVAAAVAPDDSSGRIGGQLMFDRLSPRANRGRHRQGTSAVAARGHAGAALAAGDDDVLEFGK